MNVLTISKHNWHKESHKLLCCMALLLLFSCTSSVEVKGQFPTPVINQLPLSLAVVYQPEFQNFTYIEQSEKRSSWEIALGKAQVSLFDVVLTAMFERVSKAQVVGVGNSDVDLFFQPSIESFQYNVPSETKGKMFEVWLKYHFKVFDGQGQMIADWILTAYGKTPSAFLKSEEAALNEAMVIALRDAGAGLSLRFQRIPEISQWLKQHQVLKNKPMMHGVVQLKDSKPVDVNRTALTEIAD